MTPYLLILVISVLIAYFGRQYGNHSERVITITFSALILVLFAGLRDQSIGTDTGSYVSWLGTLDTLDRVWASQLEPGYSLLVLISSYLSPGYVPLLTITSLITVALYLSTIFRLAYRYETALFVFITLGSYTFSFNGARQGLAAAVCFFALPWLLRRKALPYFALIIFASMFHKTALIALPIYYFAGSRINLKHMGYVLLGTVLLAVSLSVFAQLAASLIDEKYATYGKAGEGGGEVKVAFLLTQGFILYSFRKQVRDLSGTYARLLNIYFIGLAIALASVIASVNPSGVLRLTAYFSHTAILLWPMLFSSFRNLHSKTILTIMFFIVTITYFILTTSSFSNLTPYQINSEIFSWH